MSDICIETVTLQNSLPKYIAEQGVQSIANMGISIVWRNSEHL
jgi:hypothetical protein